MRLELWGTSSFKSGLILAPGFQPNLLLGLMASLWGEEGLPGLPPRAAGSGGGVGTASFILVPTSAHNGGGHNCFQTGYLHYHLVLLPKKLLPEAPPDSEKR